MYPMIQTLCSTIYCLQVTLAPGQIPVAKAYQNNSKVFIETLNHTKYSCAKTNVFYKCIKYK